MGCTRIVRLPHAIANLTTDVLLGRAVRMAGALEMFCPARQDALQHLWRQPTHIRNAYHLLTTEEKRWDRSRQNHIDLVQIKDPPISLRVFFKLCNELGVPSQLQLEIATTEKPTGGLFFVW